MNDDRPDWTPEPPPDWPPPPPPVFWQPAAPEPPRQAPAADQLQSPQSLYAPMPPGPSDGRRRHTQRNVLLVVLVVLAVVLSIVAMGCYSALRGCQSVVSGIKTEYAKNGWKTRDWGWRDGSGPADQGLGYKMQAPRLPSDTAPADAAKDGRSRKNLLRVQAGLEAYRDKHGDYPREAGPGTAMARYVKPWPKNPWTGEPLRDSLHRGDFSFETWGTGLDLTVHLSP